MDPTRQPAAALGQQFRIATYNVHKCRGLDGRLRVERIAAVLAELEADCVALQEVFADQASALAAGLGWELIFGQARLHRGAAYGNATLSRVRFALAGTIDLTAGREPRLALRGDLEVGSERLHVFNVHLGTAYGERRRQARHLASGHLLRAADLVGPRIILGDFNEWTRGEVTRTLQSEFPATSAPRRAFPPLLPVLGLDHIYCDRRLAVLRLWHHRSRRAWIASDHLPLVADLALG